MPDVIAFYHIKTQDQNLTRYNTDHGQAGAIIQINFIAVGYLILSIPFFFFLRQSYFGSGEEDFKTDFKRVYIIYGIAVT